MHQRIVTTAHPEREVSRTTVKRGSCYLTEIQSRQEWHAPGYAGHSYLITRTYLSTVSGRLGTLISKSRERLAAANA